MSNILQTLILAGAMPALLCSQAPAPAKPEAAKPESAKPEQKAKETAVSLPKEEKVYVTTRDFKSKLLVLEYRNPETLLNALRPLGSGFMGASMSANEVGGMKTLSVRDFPENIAAIEDALKRLDKPLAQEMEAELTLYVLQGHREPVKGGDPMPENLAPVVQSLKSTLTYKHYTLAGTFIRRSAKGYLSGSGSLNFQTNTDNKYRCDYGIIHLGINQAPDQSVQFDLDRFDFRIPNSDVNLRSSLRLKESETVVVGVSAQDDKGLIVVLSAKVVK